MAEAKKGSFPTIPEPHWWALRRKFQQTIPGVVTANYIASVLDMQEASARANVLPALRSTKLIDVDGKPMERAKKWRDDQSYPKVCAEVRQEIYSQDLLDAVPDPSKDRAGAARWFANHTGAGEAAVEKMVRFYVLLSSGDPKAASEPKPSEHPKQGKATKPPKQSLPVRRVHIQDPPPKEEKEEKERIQRDVAGPGVHINLQIHISSDASADQIDQVFQSMAKHIYKKGAE